MTSRTRHRPRGLKRLLRHSLRFFLLPLAGLLVLSVSGVLALRAHSQGSIRASRSIETPNGIESLERVKIGGIEQWILVRGRDRSNPVLLYLHGGPGGSAIPSAHLFQDRWEEHFTVVHWDQRGTGKTHRSNGRRIAATLTVERILEDAHELVLYLRRRFAQRRILLLGHSWGSYLGMRLVKEHPGLFHAYLGVGQLVDSQENFRLSYEYTLRSARERRDRRAVAQLRAIGPPPYPRHQAPRRIGVMQRWLLRYGGSIHRVTGNVDLLRAYWSLYFVAPELTLRDLYYGFDGARFSYEVLGEAFLDLELASYGSDYEVPIFFFLGRHDYQTPSQLAATFMEQLRSPHKELVWFEHSAHGPMVEEPERFTEELLQRVGPFARGGAGVGQEDQG